MGGIKITRSAGKLPVYISVEPLQLTPQFVDQFSRHLVLIYTGKTRLARNLLQNVVRNWYVSPGVMPSADRRDVCCVNAEFYAADNIPAFFHRYARSAEIVRNVDALTANAEDSAKVRSGN